MRKYIPADKLIAHIKGIVAAVQVKTHPDVFGSLEQCMAASEIEALNLVIETINELQQEQPEVDLEKAFAHEYAIYHLPNFIIASIVNGTELIDFIYNTARHFYELGLNAKER